MTRTSRSARHALVLAVVLVASAPGVAAADWTQPVPGASPINHAAAKNATEVALTTVAGVPHVTWNEDVTENSSQIRVARLKADGTAWEKVGNTGPNPISYLDSTSSDKPSITSEGTVPWVAWKEGYGPNNSEIRVARLNGAGTAWQRVPDVLRPVNHLRADPGGMADHPTIVGSGGRPFVSFFESDPGSGSLFFGSAQDPAKIWVMRLNAAGTAWEEVGGGPANAFPTDAAFPRMALLNGVPWVVFFQVNTSNGFALEIRVARLAADSGSWEQVGGPLVSTSSPDSLGPPDIAVVGGRPMVAFPDRMGTSGHRVRVLQLDAAGTGWEAVGGAPVTSGSDHENLSLADVGGKPWVAYRDSGQGGRVIRVARFDGTAWSAAGTTPSVVGSGGSEVPPDLASVNGFPWVAFAQFDNTTQGQPGVEPCCVQTRVSRLEPAFGALFTQSTFTATAFATPVDAFGLPYPVGFDYGPGTTLGSSTAPAAPGTDGFATGKATGLEPDRLHSVRPFALAGTPAPRVLGSPTLFLSGGAPPAGSAETPATAAAPPAPAVPVTGGGASVGEDARSVRQRLLVAVLAERLRSVRGSRLRIPFLVSEDATATVQIMKGRTVVATVSRAVLAGRRAVVWSGSATAGRPVGRGLHSVVLTVRDEAGRTASDRVPLLIRRAAPSNGKRRR